MAKHSPRSAGPTLTTPIEQAIETGAPIVRATPAELPDVAPTRGRIVLVTVPGDADELPAIVTHADGSTIHADVFGHRAARRMLRVQYSATPRGGCWRWPPRD